MELFISILTISFSALISFVVSILNNKRQKNLEFNYDYRKYILDKRKKAYEKIEALIETYNSDYWSSILKGSAEWESVTGGTTEMFKNHKGMVAKLKRYNIWFSQEVNLKLSAIEKCIEELSDFSSPELLKWKGGMMVWNGEFMQFHTELLEAYFADITKLDDIDYFKSQKIAEHQHNVALIKDMYSLYSNNPNQHSS